MHRRRHLVALPVLLAVGAACGGGTAATPSASPSASPAPTSLESTAPATPMPPAATTGPREDLASFAPDDAWRPILELVSGSGGLDRGTFETPNRYRLRLDCVGEGSITVRVRGQEPVQQACGQSPPEPVTVKRAEGSHRARVVAEGEVEWRVLFEVPRD